MWFIARKCRTAIEVKKQRHQRRPLSMGTHCWWIQVGVAQTRNVTLNSRGSFAAS